MPIYSGPGNANPIILVSFNRTAVGTSRGLRGVMKFEKGCGGFYTDFEGEFVSPNYPGLNSENKEIFCNWYDI